MAAAGRPSVAVIVLDTLRKDRFDEWFDWLPGRRFERAYSTANWTVPAHASLFGGQYASELGVHAGAMQFDHEAPTLAERLAAAGYTTRAYSANPNVSGRRDFDRGFEQFEAPGRLRSLSVDEVVDWPTFAANTDADGVRRHLLAVRECLRPEYDTLASLRAGFRTWCDDSPVVNVRGTAEATAFVDDVAFDGPEFLFVNVMEVHEPYDAPEPYATTEMPPLTTAVGDLSEDSVDGDHVRQAYDDCARYLADAYRDLFERLQDSFEYVITLADHGESLGKDDVWGHEHGVSPALVHVPLVVSGPGFDGRSNEPVSLLDVHQTVLSLADVDAPSRGRDLAADEGDREVCLTEYLGLTPWSRETLSDWGVPGETVARYDATLRGIATREGYGYETVDGFEQDGALPDSEATGEDLACRLRTLVEDLEPRSVEGTDEVPESVRDRLEGLGYA